MVPRALFERLKLTDQDLEAIGLSYAALDQIFDRFAARISELRSHAESIARLLQSIPEVHSIKYRVKDPEHLIEKVIRKARQNPGRVITAENYDKEVTDLIGVRALHLYKQDWFQIHDAIIQKWAMRDGHEPIAYIRVGDDASAFKDTKCRVTEHDRGYRSIHYVIEFQPTRERIAAEIQVRTLFEEAWSEIDHQVAYPHLPDDPLLLEYLQIFNVFAGSADRMGSFIRVMKTALDERRQASVQLAEQKDAEIKTMLADLQAVKAEKTKGQAENLKLQSTINKLEEQLKRAHIEASPSKTTLSSLTTSTSKLRLFGSARSLEDQVQSLSSSSLFGLNRHCDRCGRTVLPNETMLGGTCIECLAKGITGS